MPAVLTIPELPEAAPPRKRFTVAEVDRMLELGLFADERHELIDGDLLVKNGQSPQHVYSIQYGTAALLKSFPGERILVQMPVQAAGSDAEYSLPEPDLGVLHQFTIEHAHRQPGDAEYGLIQTYSEKDPVSFPGRPDSVTVSNLLPPA